MGWDVTVFDGAKEDLQDLDLLSGQKFDAIIDFNSQMPKLDTTDDEYYLDTIDAPFYDYILDHPMFHHDMLKHELRNFHVICIDEDHVDYIKEWYPHIRSVTMLPLPGTKADEIIPFQKRSIPILFTGTYTDPHMILGLVQNFGRHLKKEMTDLIEILTEDPSKTMEAAFEELIRSTGYDGESLPDFFPTRMHAYFLVETYITAYFRSKAVMNAAAAGIPMTIVGHNWEKCNPLQALSHVQIKPPVDFDRTFGLMADSQIVFNVMPWFKNGCHDRIMSAALNGAVPMSDRSGWFDGRATHGEDILLYSLEHTEDIPNILSRAFDDMPNLERIAENAQKKAVPHNWRNRCEKLAEIIALSES
ncbi:MAG: hypothetical protein K5840_02505 [Eubacterium sp.]|nr:hypothetical protein [Eubacterium sp.]